MKYIKIGGAIIAAQNINMFGCTCGDNKETEQDIDEIIKCFGVTKDYILHTKTGTVDKAKVADIKSYVTKEDGKKVDENKKKFKKQIDEEGYKLFVLAKANAKSRKFTLVALLAKNLNLNTEEFGPSAESLADLVAKESDIDVFLHIIAGSSGPEFKCYTKKKKDETPSGTPSGIPSSTPGGEGGGAPKTDTTSTTPDTTSTTTGGK